jgi:hypothetical protein
MLSVQDPRKLATRSHPPTARCADMEVGVVVPLQVVRHAALQAASANDQVD